MERKSKFLIVLLVVFAMTIGLSACNKGNNSDFQTFCRFKMEKHGEEYTIKKYKKDSYRSRVLSIPNKYKGKQVTRIGKDAFSDKILLDKIDIPSSIIEIGDGAFWNSHLETVVLNSGLKRIGKRAFEKTSIKSLTIPNTVEEIGEYAFSGTSFLKTVTLQEGIKRIKEGTFSNSDIKTITIPSSVEEIGEFAFHGCNLEEINCRVKKSYYNAHKEKFGGLTEFYDSVNWLND